MKRNLGLSLTAIIAFSIILSVACKKSHDDKPRPELIVGSWILTSDAYSPAYDYNGNGTTVTEAFPIYESCSKDDFFTFAANNTGTFDEGATKCDPGDDQSFPFVWQMTDNDSKIMIAGFSSSAASILQLDNSTLKVSTTFVENGTTYTNTQTFKRK